MSDDHLRAALVAHLGRERFEIRQLHRELGSVSALAAIEADTASAVGAFLRSSGPGPWSVHEHVAKECPGSRVGR